MQGLSWHFAQVGCVWLVPPRQLAACASQNEASEDTWLHPTRADAGGGFATDGSFGVLCYVLHLVLGWVATPSCVFGDVVRIA